MRKLVSRTIVAHAFAFVASFMLSSSAMAVGGGGNADDPAADYAVAGPSTTITESGGSNCTIYRPRTLTGNHPIVLWGNGTGNRPDSYDGGLTHLASWGFVVAAANTTNAGTGSAMIGCLDWLETSSLRSFLDFSKVGTSGHSQGGGGSIMAGRDSRIDATAPMAAFTIGLGHNSSSQRQQRGPMLLLSGSSDFIAAPRSNQEPVFNRANVPVFWATLNGAGHSEPSGDFGDFRGITTAWFLYLLKGDSSLANLFEGNNCAFCTADGWDIQQKDI
ncbi:hypothetical protein [Agarilytica rhodophyticola]|uniref:poly(ethylene terephthalate) hydrolase family protein n=1 Tax=Agarilytica rhodophyticola TaxID=1737490 RepID=UPI001C1FCC84|nr:hypothetical protein [Agarilytica rhodophyticola]